MKIKNEEWIKFFKENENLDLIRNYADEISNNVVEGIKEDIKDIKGIPYGKNFLVLNEYDKQYFVEELLYLIESKVNDYRKEVRNG